MTEPNARGVGAPAAPSPAPAVRGGPGRAAWALLVLGVVSASVSAILIRYASDAGALAISWWRCAAGAILLVPFAARGLRRLAPRELLTPGLAGVFLALHFATWISSLGLTTIAASVLLVSTTPVFVALALRLFWNQRLAARAVAGIGLALGGTALIAGADFGGSSLAGNILAIAGGATAGGYVLGGRLARRRLGILEYSVAAYASAAVLLVIACLLAGVDLWGYDARTWWAIAALVAGPQLLGHTVINLVLKDIDATTVSVAIMAEPIIAVTLAWALLSEVPAALAYPGGAAVLVGIYLVSRNSRPPAPAVAE